MSEKKLENAVRNTRDCINSSIAIDHERESQKSALMLIEHRRACLQPDVQSIGQ